ncbi:S-layer homology domain-containing protein [Rossellomorea sp. YZS02]|uniref:S-layer homology domain-containing protein n=1 Tax=Rossellomorea sp. YZS02 TaxID=3097358 RepID=UPI002A1840C0|nr:S-layer homology domain-containing protein [Rossellomorea sp. YZS02]MDX8343183.1 S-layer homology domain-containing protein [Rossellomorea sp. YZS02]
MFKSKYSAHNRKGVINGFSDGKFQPHTEITRQQAALMVARALNLDTNNRPSPSQTDLSKSMAGYKQISAVIDEGLFDEFISSSKFDPYKKLTRGEMAAIISKGFNLKANTSSTKLTDVSSFWGREYVLALENNGITLGYSDKTFRPDTSLTRAHFSIFMARAMEESFQ